MMLAIFSKVPESAYYLIWKYVNKMLPFKFQKESNVGILAPTAVSHKILSPYLKTSNHSFAGARLSG